MTARQPRFEVARTDAGFVGRFIAANGRTVWVTESQTRKVGVLRAIKAITGRQVRTHHGNLEAEVSMAVDPWGLLEVREVDERTQDGAQ